MYSAYIGVDPGTGGSAVMWTGNNKVAFYDWGDLVSASKWLVTCRESFKIRGMALENPTSNIRNHQGFFGLSKLQRNVGHWEGLACGLGIRTVLINPTTWKAAFNLMKSKDTKRASLEMVRELVPSHERYFRRIKDHNRAEALLLIFYLKERDRTENFKKQRVLSGI